MVKLNNQSFTIRVRRGLTATVNAATTCWKEGELGYTTDTKQLYVSDGTSALPVPIEDANADLTVGASASATTATGGFLYVPAVAGAPTGTLASKSGYVAVCYDATNGD